MAGLDLLIVDIDVKSSHQNGNVSAEAERNLLANLPGLLQQLVGVDSRVSIAGRLASRHDCVLLGVFCFIGEPLP